MAEAVPLVPIGPDDRYVVTVGTFDGVHRGHAHLLRALLRAAAERGARSLLVTFDPHPLTVVRPADAPQLLTTPREKIEVLAASGLDVLVVLRFNKTIADYTPRQFVEELLIQRLGMTHLVVGYDHGFGRGRSGNAETLRALGRELGFGVDVVEPLRGVRGPVSSTAIRAALREGDVLGAAEALGRPYTLTGTVVRGDGRGRELGFPTANLAIGRPDKLVPRDGIYAVRASVGGRLHDGVLHIGPRPVFPGASPSIELHLFDFSGSLYGCEVRVDFCARLRGVESFPDAGALARAIALDCAEARRILESTAGACGLLPEALV